MAEGRTADTRKADAPVAVTRHLKECITRASFPVSSFALSHVSGAERMRCHRIPTLPRHPPPATRSMHPLLHIRTARGAVPTSRQQHPFSPRFSPQRSPRCSPLMIAQAVGRFALLHLGKQPAASSPVSDLPLSHASGAERTRCHRLPASRSVALFDLYKNMRSLTSLTN